LISVTVDAARSCSPAEERSQPGWPDRPRVRSRRTQRRPGAARAEFL